MKTNRCLRSACCWFAVFAIVTLPLFAQEGAQQASVEQPAPGTPGTVLRSSSGLVLIDTIVTEDGKPVTDLEAKDFHVLENGKPQTVRVFQFQHYTPPPPGTPGIAQRTLPPGVFTNIAPPVQVPPTILLLDLLNTPLSDQNRAKQDILKYLKHVQEGEQVCIYLLGNDLKLLQDFTSDAKLLSAAIEKVMAQPTALASDISQDRPGVTSSPAFADVPEMARVVQALQDGFAVDEAQRRRMGVMLTFNSLREIAEHASGFPGRKNLLWMSGFFPIAFDPSEGPSYSTTVEYYGNMLIRTSALMAANQVAIYPIDARGLVAMPNNNIATAATGRTGSASTALAAKNGDDPFRAGFITDSHITMEQVANETGGHAYYNRNEIDRAITLAVSDGSSYYTLGYYPEKKDWDGKYRKIEVKVDRKGVKVRARKGYFAYDPTRMNELGANVSKQEFRQAMQFGTSDLSTVAFAVRVTPPAASGAPLQVDYGVNPHTLTFTPKGEAEAVSVDFVVQAFTPQGKLVNNVAETYNLAFKPDGFQQLMASKFPYSQKLNLPPGHYVLKIGVRDNRSGLLGTVTGNTEIVAAANGK